MAMTAGNVTIDDDGTEHTGADMASSIYGQLKLQGIATLATFGQSMPLGAGSAAMKRGWAVIANAVATGVVLHITSAAQVKISSTTGALQISTAVGASTNPPTTDKFLPII